MSQKSNRPPHDRSRRINDNENNLIIQLVERADGVVHTFIKNKYNYAHIKALVLFIDTCNSPNSVMAIAKTISYTMG